MGREGTEMFDYYFTFRSITGAQRGERALQKEGVECILSRSPKKLSQNGCGYVLKLREKNVYAALIALEHWGVEYGKLYRMGMDGEAEEAGV